MALPSVPYQKWMPHYRLCLRMAMVFFFFRLYFCSGVVVKQTQTFAIINNFSEHIKTKSSDRERELSKKDVFIATRDTSTCTYKQIIRNKGEQTKQQREDTTNKTRPRCSTSSDKEQGLPRDTRAPQTRG